MRESNFSIPNANKASVGITPALYDRRALDCTSTLPLINSLNNLAYLTTSSARIRDILTVDGGVERLVCILKQGRSKDLMEMWKWNLAFQCVVNLGVRGSESVRRRVVEADIVPVVATILDNYIQAIEKCREIDTARSTLGVANLGASSSSASTAVSTPDGTGPTAASSYYSPRPSRSEARPPHYRADRSRRHQPPPPLDLPSSTSASSSSTPLRRPDCPQSARGRPTHPPLQRSLTSPSSSTAVSTSSAVSRQETLTPIPPFQGRRAFQSEMSSPAVSPLPSDPDQIFGSSPFGRNINGLGVHAVRDVERLPSMLPTSSAASTELTSQPTSPSTPTPGQSRPTSRETGQLNSDMATSVPGANWDGEEQNETDGSDTAQRPQVEPPIGIQNSDTVMLDVTEEAANLVDGSATPVPLDAPNVNVVADADVFITPHNLELDDSINHTAANTPAQDPNAFHQTAPLPPVNFVNATPPNARQTVDSYYGRLPAMPNLLAALPREEDVVMALQLLAYVSKYCNLRSFFQATHLVLRLKVGDELKALDADFDSCRIVPKTQEELDADWDNEFVCEDGVRPYNIFPLIERFTVKPTSRQAAQSAPQQIDRMQYWAGVVMRNLCRKDETRGGIRQCAFWKCGKWEEYPRQFAKCRRCRRTKYCSKECQKGAWGTHRFWCVAAEDNREVEGSRQQQQQHYVHHHHHHHHHNHQHHRRQVEAGGAVGAVAGPDAA